MHKNVLNYLRIFACCVFPLLFSSPFLHAQGVVSGGMTGLVRDTAGKTVPGANIKAVHVPTGTTYTAVTNASGRFNISGMVVGGPYTVSADATGFKSMESTDIVTQLGATIDVNLALESSGIVTLDKVTVSGAGVALDSAASGAGSVVGASNIGTVPTVQRSFADVTRTTPFVSLRGVLSSRNQPIISAVGQNNRFNSILVDGARINDQFGLNGSGLQAFGNPISLDTIEQFNISISPYDASQSGFTGASINAVTKSGTNQFHGSLYYYYTNDDFQGANVFGSTAGTRAFLEQKTKGFTIGGPILKNRLFFFANYEKFESISPETAGFDPTASTQGAADFAAVNTRLASIKSSLSYGSGLDFGTFLGRTAPLNVFNEIKLAKVDWQIAQGQRFSIRYNKTEGEFPQSGRYSLVNQSATSGSGIANASFSTNLSSQRYNQVRSEEVWAAQLFSTWTPSFKTEVRYAQNEYSQATPVPITFPEVRIFGFSGIANTGASISNGALFLGTEQNRQGNFLSVKTKSMSGSGEYLMDQFTFSGGFDREESDFLNLFRGNSYGVFDYASVTAFLNDTPSAFSRAYYQVGTSPSENSDFAINGIFGQVKWDVAPRLNVTFGLRYDFFTTEANPPFNPLFKQVFGFANNGNIDGSNSFSPRLSFNYGIDDARRLQLRGGIGHFVGRIPWVMVSNSFGSSGVGRTSELITSGPPTLSSYLTNTFDPKNPIGTIATATITRPSLNIVKDKLDAPAVWRGNLALDATLPGINSTLTVEAIHTRVDKALFIRDLNLKPRFVGLDGRQIFSGNPGVTTAPANALHPEFGNVYAVDNVEKGSSTYISFGLNRPMRKSWSYNFTYTVGKAEDALPLGETTAGSQFGRNAIFNQNEPTLSRSAFEVRNRVQFTLAKEFRFFRDWKTTLSLYYEGRSGNPYSFTYASDANADGVTGNDLVYVPTGTSDPVFANVSASYAQSYMNYVEGSELAGYKGRTTARHGFTQPWTNRLDLHVSQTIGIYKPAELEIFADFINFGAWLSKDLFGYYEMIRSGSSDNELAVVKNLGAASYDPNTRQLLLTNAATFANPVFPTPDNELSRWRIQFGARLKF
jgi:outer membrane receptor protein involved in Fe transport